MAGEHAGALAFHMHLGERSGVYFGSLEDSAQKLNWFVLKKADPPVLPAVAAKADAVEQQSPRTGLEPRDNGTAVVESPHLRRLAPRAPPA